MSTQPHQKMTVGLMIPSLGHYYSRKLWREIYAYASRSGCNLMVFCGQPLTLYDDKFDHSNLIYTLMDASILNGLIFATPSVASYITMDEFHTLRSQFQHIPTVSVGMALDDMNNVVVSNEISSQNLIRHLIVDHGYHDIVYVAGPRSNEEAVARKRGFIQAMMEQGLPIDESKIIETGFHWIFGERAARQIVETYPQLPQAIACGDDEIAIGVCEELKKLGITVPDDVAVVGFDNSDKAANNSPGLTTVNQPFAQMAKTSIDLIVHCLNENPPPQTQELIASTVIRQSCACSRRHQIMDTLHHDMTPNTLHPVDGSIQENLVANRSEIIRLFAKTLDKNEPNMQRFIPIIHKAVDIFIDEFVCQQEPNHSANTLLKMSHLYKINWNLELNIDLILLVLERIFHQLFIHTSYSDYSISYLSQLRLILFEKKELDLKLELFTSNTVNALNAEFSNRLSNVVDMSGLLKSVEYYIRSCKFTQAYLCLFDSPVQIQPSTRMAYPKMCNMIYGKKNGQIYENIPFQTPDILPQSILHDGTVNNLVFYPLHQGNQHFGYFAGDSMTMHDYNIVNLQQQLSGVLERLRLIEELEEYTQRIEKLSIIDELTGLYNRRGFYEAGMKQYEAAQQQHRKLVFIFGDMDGLKKINDTYGHKAGDIALKAVADSLNKALRSTDIISRLSGDEFAIILCREDTTDNVHAIIERIEIALDDFNDHHDLPYTIQVSFGYAIFDGQMQRSFEELLNEADKKLYENKRDRYARAAHLAAKTTLQ